MPIVATASVRSSRKLIIALAVAALHLGLIWALQSGLLIRATEILVPVELLSELIAPPQAPKQPATMQATPSTRPQLPPPAKVPAPAQALERQTPNPAPAPAAVAAPLVAPLAAPLLAAVPAPAVATLPAAPPLQSQAAATPAPASPAVLQAPSSNADYLQNPKPPYPPMSARLGETGRTVYKVWIGVDGKPQRAELVSSSGFPRLDKAAHDTVMGWHYVPGKRNGVPEAMAVNVPIQWELNR
jgi:protein TonB